jgi:hypothetical protein
MITGTINHEGLSFEIKDDNATFAFRPIEFNGVTLKKGVWLYARNKGEFAACLVPFEVMNRLFEFYEKRKAEIQSPPPGS